MVRDGYWAAEGRDEMLDELLSLKYMEHMSPFVRKLAKSHHEGLPNRTA